MRLAISARDKDGNEVITLFDTSKYDCTISILLDEETKELFNNTKADTCVTFFPDTEACKNLKNRERQHTTLVRLIR